MKAANYFSVVKPPLNVPTISFVSEGYITSKPQTGYFVIINEARIKLHKKISQYHFHQQPICYDYDLRSQTVYYDSQEMLLWKKYLQDVLQNNRHLTSYGDSQGEIELREALSLYAYKMRGVLSHPDYCEFSVIIIYFYGSDSCQQSYWNGISGKISG